VLGLVFMTQQPIIITDIAGLLHNLPMTLMCNVGTENHLVFVLFSSTPDSEKQRYSLKTGS
jgi:hypothetical protein